MEKFFRELFDYHSHCNQEIFHLIDRHREATSYRSLQLFNHIINAHHIWNNRIIGQNALYGVWDTHDFKSLENINIDNTLISLNIIERYDLEISVDYSNSTGEPFTNKIRDILFHIINHSTHHRAQIGIDMKLSNVTPIPMDYIFYKR